MTTRRFARLILATSAALTLAGCTGDGGGGPSETVTTTPPTTAATTTSPTAGGPACLSGDIAFGVTGLVGTPGEDTGDAARLAGVTWRTFDGCERLELQFVTGDGAPASLLGAASAELRDSAGIVRLTLPPLVTTTSVADGLVDGELVQRFFVVRDADGTLVVDLHLTAAARRSGVAARAFDVDAPARAIVDLRPGGTPATAPPTATDTLVLLLPPSGPVVLPFLVRGYARATDGGIGASLMAGGTEVMTSRVEGMPPDDAWRAFETVIDAGTPGPARLVVAGPDGEVTVDVEIVR